MHIQVYNRDELEERNVTVGDLCTALQEELDQLHIGIGSFGFKRNLIFLNKLRNGLYSKQRGDFWRNYLLKPAQWVALFDAINDVLDRYEVEAICQTAKYRFRLGRHRRVFYDDRVDRYSKTFNFKYDEENKFGKPDDYKGLSETKVVMTYGKYLNRMVVSNYDK